MSVSRLSPYERHIRAELAKIRKKVTGSTTSIPKCCVCGKVLTEQELLSEDFVWCVGRNNSAQFHRECFRKEFGKKEAQDG